MATQSQPTQTPLSDELRTFLTAHGFASDDIGGRDRDHATPLMLAVRLAPVTLVEELLEAGADIHAQNTDGNQALWLACVGENEDIIALLIDAGAEIEHVNATGATPLMFTASSGRSTALARLLAAGADPLHETSLGLAALDMAATKECLDMMRDAVRRRKSVDDFEA